MIFKNMTVVDAIDHVKKQHSILPNRGFLKQLRDLDIQLQEQRDKTKNWESRQHSLRLTSGFIMWLVLNGIKYITWKQAIFANSMPQEFLPNYIFKIKKLI